MQQCNAITLTDAFRQSESQIPKFAILDHIINPLSLNNALLLVISAHPVISVCEVGASHVLQELLVMSDYNQLEVLLVGASLDDLVQRLS